MISLGKALFHNFNLKTISQNERSYSMSVFCPQCGYQNDWDAQQCEECGFELKELESTEQDSYDNINNVEQNSAEFSENEDSSNFELVKKNLLEENQDTSELSRENPEIESTFSEDELEEDYIPATVTRLEIDEPEFLAPALVTTMELPSIKALLIQPETEKVFELPSIEKIIYIGRTNEERPVQVDLTFLPDSDVISRIHAAITVENDNYFLEDTGSSNGTWLNEEKLEPGNRHRLKINSGDVIAFGKSKSIKLEFKLDE